MVERIEEPLFGLFLALAGAHLDLSAIHSAGWLALVLMLVRFGGKLLGSYVGARLCDAPQVVRRLLGLALLPRPALRSAW